MYISFLQSLEFHVQRVVFDLNYYEQYSFTSSIRQLSLQHSSTIVYTERFFRINSFASLLPIRRDPVKKTLCYYHGNNIMRRGPSAKHACFICQDEAAILDKVLCDVVM